jgi:hypothetical protein
MAIPFATNTEHADEFLLYHHRHTGRQGRPSLVPLLEADYPALQAKVATEMHAFAKLAIAKLADRFPNDEYLEQLEFLHSTFWQLDCLDTRETIRSKVAEVNVQTL